LILTTFLPYKEYKRTLLLFDLETLKYLAISATAVVPEASSLAPLFIKSPLIPSLAKPI
jgi:hypothetical protein